MMILRLGITNCTKTNNPFRTEWRAVRRAVMIWRPGQDICL